MTATLVRVAVPVPARREFVYRVAPEHQVADLIGRRVIVPFGARKLTGIVVGIAVKSPVVAGRLKNVLDLLDEAPLVDETILRLTKWVSDYYLSSWGETLRAALPVGWNRKSRRYACFADSGTLAVEEEGGLESMIRHEGRIPVATLVRRIGDGHAVEKELRRLVRSGSVEIRSFLEAPSVGPATEVWAEVLPAGCDEAAETSIRTNAVRQRECLFLLRERGRARRAELAGRFGTAVSALEKKGFIRFVEEEKRRIADGGLDTVQEEDPILTDEQEAAIDPVVAAIREERFEVRLLHGVTGSGKTEVYIRAAMEARARGKTVLVLVPEIALTPQTVGRFRARFGNDAVVLHSGLTPAERHDTWREIHRGKLPVVVGVRSAVFAPLRNLGLIVVDEEHETSYKQSESPRYHARDIAVVRGKMENAPVILGSATPSVESFGNAMQGKYEISVMRRRIENRPLPKVETIDLREVPYEMRVGVLTAPLVARIAEALSLEDQVMIFLNRRGYSPFLECKDCGWVPRCPHCEVTYTYHKKVLVLRCHYCGTEKKPPTACDECRGDKVSHRGIGTQKVEEDLTKAFPDATIARMDTDTTRRRDAARGILDRFSKGKIDILIGTQMIAKGHDFPGVSLVGVINADTSLHFPDFRAGERSFQLLTQVAGRAGRGDRKGEVILQSFGPDHYCIQSASRHDYDGFVEKELAERAELHYPPYSRIVAITFRAKAAESAQKAAAAFRDRLRTSREIGECVWDVLGPAPAPIPKIRDKHRWRLIIKGRTEKWGKLRTALIGILEDFRNSPAGKRAETLVDVDALDLL